VTVTWPDLERDIAGLAASWKADRAARQARRHLDLADFDRLRDIGFLHVVVPEAQGGLWAGIPASSRSVCGVLRTLASGDPSVALVSAMHPAVVGFWLAPESTSPRWVEQRDAVTASAAAGIRWGTITSEPGSGGDIAKTRSTAEPRPGLDVPIPGDAYVVTGDKHFGSGSGINDLMLTSAVPNDGDGRPALFVLDVRGRPWDGSTGLRLVAEWDGVGMAATQSHAMRLEGCPAVRLAWDGAIEEITAAAGPFFALLFTAVILGVLDEAIGTARAQLAAKADELRAFERVEWTRAEMDHWVAVQVYEGALRTIESGDPLAALHAGLRAKTAVAELAEATLSRLARVLGGGSFSRRSPFSAWYEDVRALGFLRPPWGLAYDGLFATSFPAG
jgi:alkylation response protein AidB-like acyl-CoA dehydrogenase